MSEMEIGLIYPAEERVRAVDHVAAKNGSIRKYAKFGCGHRVAIPSYITVGCWWVCRFCPMRGEP